MQNNAVSDSGENTLFESEETILRDIYSITENFRQRNTLHRRRISDLRRARVQEEENMKEMFQMGIDLWHDRKFGCPKAQKVSARKTLNSCHTVDNKTGGNQVNTNNKRYDNKDDNSYDSETSNEIICRRPPPFLPPIHRQTEFELRRIDYSNEIVSNHHPLTERDICNTRYLRLPRKYIPKT